MRSEKGPSRRDILRGIGGLTAGSAMARLFGGESFAQAQGLSASQPAASQAAASPPAASQPINAGPIDPSEKSIVAHVRRQEVIDGTRFHDVLLGEMIADGLKLLTGKEKAADAWNTLLKPDDRIAIKFNQVGDDHLNTTTPFATALVESLKQAGFGPEKIILIEAPGRLNRILKTRPAIPGWSGGEVDFGSGAEELVAVLQETTAIINVPFLKTHNIAGMTGCLKNLSHALVRRPGRYHANACAPFVGDIVALPQIHSKLRLHIMNALRAVYKGGPAVSAENMWTHAGIIMGSDPVAVDAVGIDLINDRRMEAKLPPIGDAQSQIPHVHAAAKRGLGTDDPDFIQMVEPMPL